MNKKKIAIIGGGVAVAAVAAYFLYNRSRQSAQAVQQSNQFLTLTQNAPSSDLAQYEGKGLRTPNGTIYVVRNGKLQHIATPNAMQRVWGTKRFEDVRSRGELVEVGFDVVARFPQGPAINGLGSTDYQLLIN